jgi:predicted MPP superfamily phosphohydrolase
MKKYRIHIAIVLITTVLFNIATLFLPPSFRGLSFYSLLFIFDMLVLIPFSRISNSWSHRRKKTFLLVYWMPFTLLTLIAIAAIFIPFPDWANYVKIPVATLFAALYFSHFLLCAFLLITCLIHWLIKNKRIVHFSLFSGILAAAALLAICLAAPFLWTVNPQITKVKIVSKEVPESFSGYKIVHISDLHCDFFRNEKPFHNMVNSINSLNPDLILITGDVITFKSAELKRFLNTLQPMKAKNGIYVIMGNHDYGSYYNRWKSQDELAQNQEELFGYYKQLHWRLLRNEAVYIEKNGDTLVLAGTENKCFRETHYPCTGDFHLALQEVAEHHPIILMTHNPTYWEKEISKNPHPIMLTLSGHTHGTQIGYRTDTFQWSVLSAFKKYGMGLYRENDRYLYINTGFGVVGFPFRIGLRPEITALMLEKNKNQQ